jgi:hypothetical protein
MTLTATGGLISLSELNGLTISAGTGSGDAAITFTGTLTDINNALQGLTYAPTAGFVGEGLLSVTINEVGVNQASPTKTIGIFVEAAAASAPIPVASPSFAPAISTSGDNSVLAGVLNQSLNTTSSSASPTTITQADSGLSNSTSVFSDEPIPASFTAPADDGTVAPAPAVAPAGNAPPANPAGNPVHNAAPAAKPVVAQAKPAGPASLTAHTPPNAASLVPDKVVLTVPDQVFSFLAPQSPMLNNLDTVKKDMTSQKSLKVAAGSATVVSFSASAAYLVWLLRGGSLMSSLLSIFPAWKSMDPLPVLESFEKSRKRRKGEPDDDESLESLVEKSNQNNANAANESATETGNDQ